MFSPFDNSLADLIISFRLKPITVPGPTVHGPPTVKIILGGTGAVSAKDNATLIACPVALELL